MSSFTAINFNSDSDSDDEDFVPGNSGEKATGTKVALSKKKCKSREGGIQLENAFDRAAVEALEEEEKKRRKEFDDDKEQRKHLEESKRTEDLWADFKKDTALPRSSGSSSKRVAAASTSAKPKPKSSIPFRKKSSPSLISSIFDAFEEKDVEKLDELTRSTGNEPRDEAKGVVGSIFEDVQRRSKEEVDKPGETSEKRPEEDGSKVKVTQVFDFAGESIEVSKHVDADSKEGQRFIKQQQQKKRQPLAGGLGGIVNSIAAKKPKMGCLDKSKMDWDKYVEEEGIKEDLETFNKGKNGYVEKQMFLERCDHRRFELEKGAREKTRQPLHR